MARANKKADKGNRGKSRFSDLMPNPGPGLFTLQADFDAEARAIAAIKGFLEQHTGKLNSITWETIQVVIAPKILDTVRRYRADCAYDDRMSGRELKSEALQLANAAKRLRIRLSKISPQYKVALNQEHFTRDEKDICLGGFTEQCLTMTSRLEHLSDVVASRPVQAVLRRSVKHACAQLWKVWEQATGRSFNRSLETRPGSQDTADNVLTWEMNSLDALFVQVVIQAIDPEVQTSEIHTGLQYVKAENPR